MILIKLAQLIVDIYGPTDLLCDFVELKLASVACLHILRARLVISQFVLHYLIGHYLDSDSNAKEN